jgi:RHS repeat-associated protein
LCCRWLGALSEAIDLVFGDATSGTETRRITNHYPDTSDSPSWIETSADAGRTSTWERNVKGIDGNLAAIQPSTGTVQLQLTDLHGDIVATVDDDPDAVATNDYYEHTEYGAPRTDKTTDGDRYGWLGAKQRSTDALGGIVLMGVRLYNPATGRFLSVDPVNGGNENVYTYPNDPINKIDSTGKYSTTYRKAYGNWVIFFDIYFNREETKRFKNVWGAATLWQIAYGATYQHAGKHVAISVASRLSKFLSRYIAVGIATVAFVADYYDACMGLALTCARIPFTNRWLPNASLFLHNKRRCR